MKKILLVGICLRLDFKDNTVYCLRKVSRLDRRFLDSNKTIYTEDVNILDLDSCTITSVSTSEVLREYLSNRENFIASARVMNVVEGNKTVGAIFDFIDSNINLSNSIKLVEVLTSKEHHINEFIAKAYNLPLDINRLIVSAKDLGSYLITLSSCRVEEIYKEQNKYNNIPSIDLHSCKSSNILLVSGCLDGDFMCVYTYKHNKHNKNLLTLFKMYLLSNEDIFWMWSYDNYFVVDTLCGRYVYEFNENLPKLLKTMTTSTTLNGWSVHL